MPDFDFDAHKNHAWYSLIGGFTYRGSDISSTIRSCYFLYEQCKRYAKANLESTYKVTFTLLLDY